MSSRVVLCILFLVASSAAAALDWSDFALHSDRADDPLLLDAMTGVDLETELGICRSVGLRAEPYAEDIIEAILAVHAGRNLGKSEMMLRTLLAGLLDAARAAPPLPDRVSANQEALQALCGMIPIIEDPQLVALLVKVLPAAPQLERARSLMAAADRTLQRLEQGDGRLLPQETALAMDLLGVLERIGTTDFLDFCASVTRLSRDPDLVGAARATAAALVSVSVGPRPR